MKLRQTGEPQASSAAKAGISERSGRRIECNTHIVRAERKHTWRTRKDPLMGVWSDELLPLLEQTPNLQAITLLEYLQERYPEQYPDSLHRTLQRRVKQWRALYGPEQEVIFRQIHAPGRQGLSDFTHLKLTTITVSGHPLKHLLYHFRLAYSHWSSMKVVVGGESFSALSEGLQLALRRLGGAPFEHRTDSLSAAFKNLSAEAEEDLTRRYDALCKHYGMQATRNNRGEGHENGSVESPHGHLKRRIRQALLLRGSNDFKSIDVYQTFIDKVVEQHNRRNAKTIDIERQLLQALPLYSAMDYTEVNAVVSSSSTINIRRVTYTVPSRLQSETLHIRLYDDRLECYLGHEPVITLQRIYSKDKNQRVRQIDYRHVIHSLVKKPQAFRYSQIRDDLLPNTHFRFIWFMIDTSMEPKQACKLIVGLLHLAATQDCETVLGETVLDLLENNKPVCLRQLQERFNKKTSITIPLITIIQHSLIQYNQLIPQQMEVYHGA